MVTVSLFAWYIVEAENDDEIDPCAACIGLICMVAMGWFIAGWFECKVVLVVRLLTFFSKNKV